MPNATPTTAPIAAAREEIADVMKRYSEQRYYRTRTLDTARIADYACEVLPKVREQRDDLLAACEAADKWFDGWCPTATCCAHSGKAVHLQIRDAIAKARNQ